MTVGVVTFPGSNCDLDTISALTDLGVESRLLWYRDTDIRGISHIILPGGFSYGDYLRSGALAAHAPIMDSIVEKVSQHDLPVLGICNGFQILCERGMLPGVLRANPHGEFRSSMQAVRVVDPSPVFPGLSPGQTFRFPIAHHEGSYSVMPGELQKLFENHQVFLQYSDEDGNIHAMANPNGSVANIAGVSQGSVVGLMPHPERAMHAYLGSEDGRAFLAAFLGKEGESNAS